MQKIGGNVLLSSGDLVGHLNCRYLTELDLKVANGELEKPKVWDPVLETLAERGALHEQGFIEHIIAAGIAVTVIDGVGVDSNVGRGNPRRRWPAAKLSLFRAPFRRAGGTDGPTFSVASKRRAVSAPGLTK